MDIIRYLDEIAPMPVLVPADARQRSECQSLLEAADRAQLSLKIGTHEFLWRKNGHYGEKKLKTFAAVDRNTWTVDFKLQFAAADAEWDAKAAAALGLISACVRDLDRRLADRSGWWTTASLWPMWRRPRRFTGCR